MTSHLYICAARGTEAVRVVGVHNAAAAASVAQAAPLRMRCAVASAMGHASGLRCMRVHYAAGHVQRSAARNAFRADGVQLDCNVIAVVCRAAVPGTRQ
jgi:hydroxypyruvate isomerase